MVQFSDTDWANMTFGTLSQKSKSEQTIVSHWKKVANLFGGISDQSIRKGLIPGIEMAGNGMCTIDTNAKWIHDFDVSKSDLKNGIENFIKTNRAQEILGLSGKTYGFHNNRAFASKHMKIGRTVVLHKDTVIKEAQLRTPRLVQRA